MEQATLKVIVETLGAVGVLDLLDYQPAVEALIELLPNASTDIVADSVYSLFNNIRCTKYAAGVK